MPFLYSLAFSVWILPTLFGVKNNSVILGNDEYIRYTLFSFLCFWSAIIGFSITSRADKSRNTFSFLYDEKKMSYILYGVIIIALSALVLMSGYDAESRNGGTYALLIFPARMLRPATIMLFIMYLLKPSKDKLFFLLLSLSFSLKIILVDGRRSEVFNLIITIIFPLFFIKNKVVPRILVIPSIFFAIFIITVLPAYRNYSLNGNFDEALKVSPTELMSSFIEGENRNEVVEAVKNMDVAYRSRTYNWGATAYNAFVYQFASSNLFGQDFKESLMLPYNLDLAALRDKNAKYYDDQFRFYMAPTGTAAVFFEFGFGGFLLFFVFGFFCRKFYEQASKKENVTDVMFYCFFSTFILFSVYDSLLFLPTNIILYLIVFFLAKNFSRITTYKIVRER